jgi:hypothetical protein
VKGARRGWAGARGAGRGAGGRARAAAAGESTDRRKREGLLTEAAPPTPFTLEFTPRRSRCRPRGPTRQRRPCARLPAPHATPQGARALRFVRKVPLLKGLSDNDLLRVAERMPERVYADGQALIRYGERGDEMYLIRYGKVRAGASGRTRPARGQPAAERSRRRGKTDGCLAGAHDAGMCVVVPTRHASLRAAAGLESLPLTRPNQAPQPGFLKPAHEETQRTPAPAPAPTPALP